MIKKSIETTRENKQIDTALDIIKNCRWNFLEIKKAMHNKEYGEAQAEVLLELLKKDQKKVLKKEDFSSLKNTNDWTNFSVKEENKTNALSSHNDNKKEPISTTPTQSNLWNSNWLARQKFYFRGTGKYIAFIGGAIAAVILGKYLYACYCDDTCGDDQTTAPGNEEDHVQDSQDSESPDEPTKDESSDETTDNETTKIT